MRKILYMMALMAALAMPMVAEAEAAGMYITPKFLDSLQNTGSVGGSDGLSSQTWNTVGGAIAVGLNLREFTDVGTPIRVEFEYGTRTTMKSEWNASLGAREGLKAEWQVQTFQINGYWDIETGTAFTPYLGAGVGASYIHEGMTSGSGGNRHYTEDSNWGLAWNVGAGVAYAISDNLALDLQYRFAGLGESEVKHRGGNVTNYLTANEFLAGVRLSF